MKFTPTTFINRLSIIFLLFICLISCSNIETSSNSEVLKSGNWRAVLDIGIEELPFNLIINRENNNYVFKIKNAEEIIEIKEVVFDKDSIYAKLPVFDSEFRLKIMSDTLLIGFWHNYSKSETYKIPIEIKHGNTRRFPKSKTSFRPDISGKWEATFGNDDNQYKAIGIFSQNDLTISGTFLTETGDYRYLEGDWTNGYLYLSCFDGSHAFLFKATFDLSDSERSKSFPLKGKFWSGNHWSQNWTAIKNDTFELTNPDSLTLLNQGYEKLAFQFPNLSGDTISLDDNKFINKMIIVQILGSWCPNCMDETKWLSSVYNKYNSQGLEVVGLCYERTRDFKKAVSNITRLKNRFDADYEFLIAGYADKKEAASTLPMLNHILSFPTTIFIDRKGQIRKIHTGFYGPGTGSYFTSFEENTALFIEKLLKEQF